MAKKISEYYGEDANYYPFANELELSKVYSTMCNAYGKLGAGACDPVVTSLKEWAKRKNSAKAAQKKKEEAP